MTDTRVWARLPAEIHEYFFRHVLAGEYAAKQDLTALLYEALYAECRRRNIPATWSTENRQLIHEVVSQLNFTGNHHDDQSDRSRCSAAPTPQHQA
jgi:hypothetical protein